ncbi:MAG: gamma carbonic anhydrase family protein [Alphaproteobacteria bacterium]|nr:MAG: gamma carbonic anhydrase family protein [Alphaproteobacteria bacterium]
MSKSGNIHSYKGITPTIADDVYIAPGAHIIGDVVIGATSSIWFNVVVRGDVNEIRMGERSNIQDNSVIHVTEGGAGTYIGNDVLIGHMVLMHACTIHDGALVGMGATIMDNVVVGKGAMIAAGALVTPNKQIPAGELWGGRPAKKMRDLSEAEIANNARLCHGYVIRRAEYLAEG